MVNEDVWNHSAHKAQSIILDRFEKKYEPVDCELLFFAGYSGDRSKFCFGHLSASGTPYLTQQIPIPAGVVEADANIHFALPYKPDLAISVDGTSALPRPPGFSGSLVWDTKRIACLRNKQKWSPELAKVTGLVWGWPSSHGCIIATKVEHIEIESLINLAKEYANKSINWTR
ncbi:MAG: hypothetical protein Q8L97_06250 [Nitrosomonas sp.]|nr:hypothetical protein [Nitrosomonas sp.]